MRQSLKDKSYTYIKNKIVNCEYMPGDYLDEKQLIIEIGASRTPIREALNKLEQENLINILPKKGVVVTNISYKDVVDIWELRLLIEPPILTTLKDKIDIDIIKKFKEESLTINTVDALDAHDDHVHGYFTSLYSNFYLSDLLDTINTQTHRIRHLTTRNIPNTLDKTFDEHNAIFDAIINNQFELATELMHLHLLKSKERTVNSLLKI